MLAKWLMDSGAKPVPAKKYKTRVCLDLIHGYYKDIEEIWVERPDGKSFAFNLESENSFYCFYCDSPRNYLSEHTFHTGNKKEKKETEMETEMLDHDFVQKCLLYLRTRDELLPDVKRHIEN